MLYHILTGFSLRMKTVILNFFRREGREIVGFSEVVFIQNGLKQ